jgi:hypothetical protein
MAEVILHGGWRVTVVRKESFWEQRVVVTGSANAVVPGVVSISGRTFMSFPFRGC